MRTAKPASELNVLALLAEGERMMRICNACRYCEGFCAVFPALERRLAFSERDLHYLANLCHDCGECFYSCQYAPPHEFAMNLPRTLAGIRRETYRKYAWPGLFAGWFRRSGLTLLLSAVIIPALFLLLTRYFAGAEAVFAAPTLAEGSFYQVIPHGVMIGVFGIAGVLILVVFLVGLARFWRDTGGTLRSFLNHRALSAAVSDTLRLRYLEGRGEGGGEGCAYPGEVASQARRWFHHLTFYGFLLCFAATTVAAFYHNVLGWEAPYPILSLPVVLGSVGGAGLLIGPVGLLWLKTRRNPELTDRRQTAMDVAFLVLLFLTSLTGFLLLALRERAAMGTLLAVHLGVVMGLFVALPYGKFVHAIYRFAALVRNASEEQRGAASPEPDASPATQW